MTSPGIPLNFYPRPPRGGRPHRRLPVWLVLCHFYPRPPRGGRLRLLSSSWIWPAISIHALREEGDGSLSFGRDQEKLFLSTPSARRATPAAITLAQFIIISIHALREEGDNSRSVRRDIVCNFYPRPPRGGRRIFVSAVPIALLFLSTPSARRAT